MATTPHKWTKNIVSQNKEGQTKKNTTRSRNMIVRLQPNNLLRINELECDDSNDK